MPADYYISRFRCIRLALIYALWGIGILYSGSYHQAAAAVDSLAFGSSPEAMVYLFTINEVCHFPKSELTLARVQAAIKFCRSKLAPNLVKSLETIEADLRHKKYKQAQKRARRLQNMIYGE